ncbi:hypothetical protein V6N13_024540 [Hibiscus sabdariffa]
MAGQPSHAAGGAPALFEHEAAEERYNQVVAHKNLWEEQGFKFDDGLDYYGLEMVIYKRLNDLGCLDFGRQPARANINWTREFYTHFTTSENNVVYVRGKLVPAHAAPINEILDLPSIEPSIYDLMAALEDIDYDTIKDQLCMPGTDWNITGKNPGTVNRPNLLSKAKLWNTIVKRNLMPTSHNQTVDRKRDLFVNSWRLKIQVHRVTEKPNGCRFLRLNPRFAFSSVKRRTSLRTKVVDLIELVLIHAIMHDTRFNVGEVIAKELSKACRNDKGILAFPCLISALCR